jgi:membrane fusion protein, multidrug efflux system
MATSDSTGAPPRRRHWVTPTVVVVAVIAGAAALYWNWGDIFGNPTTAAAPAPTPPTVTVSAPLYQEIIERDEYTGQFAAVEYVEVRARVSGYLQSVHFVDGQMVNKGDLLFVIDPRPFEIALDSAKALLDQAHARLELANVQLTRIAKLRENDFSAKSTYDQQVEEVRGATAAVASAEAAVHSAELNLEFTRVTAPQAGRISRHEVSVGNLVSGGDSANTTMLTTIVSLDPIYLEFDMSEQDFLGYQRAAATGRLKSTRDNNSIVVEAHLPDEDGWTMQGKLDFVDNQVDRSAGTIRARGVFPNPKLLITPGQFGRIRLPGSDPYQAILLPDSALVTDQSRKLVMTVSSDGTVVPKPVRPGPIYDALGLRIIREGLAPTDQVIINGLLRARPGAKVTPQPGAIQTEVQADAQ